MIRSLVVSLLLALPLTPVSEARSSPAAQTPAAPSWQAIAPVRGAPTARHENAAAHLDGKIYMIGGRGQRPVDILDIASGVWTQAPPPPVEMNHVQAAVHDGRIYIIGALTGPWPNEAVIPKVMIYDPATDRWTEGAEIPAERRRGGGATVVHDGLIYLVGGNRRGHMAGYVPWVDSFDPRSGLWTPLPDAPHARDHFHAAVLDGKIYAAGGRTSAHDRGKPLELTVAPMDIYDIAQKRWSSAAPIPTERSGTAAVATGGRILILGGESSAQKAGHAEVEAFDPATGRWTTLPPMPVGRHGTQAVVSGNAVHIVAGSGDRGGGPELNDHLVLTGF